MGPWLLGAWQLEVVTAGLQQRQAAHSVAEAAQHGKRNMPASCSTAFFESQFVAVSVQQLILSVESGTVSCMQCQAGSIA